MNNILILKGETYPKTSDAVTFHYIEIIKHSKLTIQVGNEH